MRRHLQRLIPRSTFGLVTAIGVALAAFTLVLGFVMQWVTHEALEQQLDHRVEAETRALLHASPGIGSLAATISARQDGHRADGLGYMLVDASGLRLAGGMRATVPPPGWHEYVTNAPPGEEAELMQSLVTELPGGERLVVAADRAPIDEIDETIISLTIGALGAMLAFGVISAALFGAVVRRRLARIVATAEAITAGDHAARVPRDGTDNEFDRLSGTLNRLLDRNTELIDNLRQVSSDVAHDLRTPLSRQQQAIEEALDGPHDASVYRQALEAAGAGGREMLDLFAAILRISEIDTFAVRSQFQAVDLAETIERVCDAYRPAAETNGQMLSCTVSDGVEVEGDRRLLTQLLANLVENTLRHTPGGTAISVSADAGPDGVVLRVADRGPGIDPEDRERVLQRFVRLERSRSTPGNGLGLSLVAAIARAHRAQLSLSDHHPGLAVTIRFPAA